jgi:hypothetical protein
LESSPPSAFGFLSSSTAAAEASTDRQEAAIDSSAAVGGSGFSFLSSANDNGDSSTHEPSNLDKVSTASTAGSSFSFLGAASSGLDEDANSRNAAPSGFSFLPSAAAQADTTISIPTQQSPIDSNNVQINSNDATNSSSDLLATTNLSLPAGAGVSWSAPPICSIKKPIKKKTGKTRVGVNNTAAASSPSLTAMPPPSTPSFVPPPVVPPSPQSPPLKVKAERAHNSAEEFIREKQRSAIAMAAKRAMLQKSDGASSATPSSSEPAWKLSNEDAYAANTLNSTPTSSPKDETYRAAKAAAEEARNVVSSKSKFSLGGFFQRKHSGSGAANGEMASYSSHGGVVGRSNNNNTTAQNSTTVGGGQSLAAQLPSTQEDRGAIDREAKHLADKAAEEEQSRLRREKQQIEKERQEKEQQRLEQERIIKQQRLEAEEAAKRRSPRQKMHAILAAFATTTKSSTQLVSQLSSQHETLSQDRILAEKNQRLAQQQIAHAESMQMKSVEEEDFESADRLATVIEGHERERKEQLEIIDKISEAMERIEKEKEEASKAVAHCFGEVYEKLKELKMEQEARRKEDGTDVS